MLAAQLPPEVESPEELATEEEAAPEVQQSEAPDENPFAMCLLSFVSCLWRHASVSCVRWPTSIFKLLHPSRCEGLSHFACFMN